MQQRMLPAVFIRGESEIIFGDIIKAAREYRKLSQEDTAVAIEKKYKVRMSASYLSMIESGARKNLTVKLLNALLDFFNLPVQAAGSLFDKPFTQMPDKKVMEGPGEYVVNRLSKEQLALLPPEAQYCLYEFQMYIWQKYSKRQ